MNQYAILYNPLANNGQGEKAAEALKEQMKIERVVVRMHLPDSSSENK